jgi:uncharacterized protein (AIM24 family)
MGCEGQNMDHEIEHRPSYALLSVELGQSEQIQAEAGAMVSHTDGIEIETEFGGGRTFFGGEGLVCEFEGQGSVWLQTRSTDAFLSWLIPNLPTGDGGDHDSGFSVDF